MVKLKTEIEFWCLDSLPDYNVKPLASSIEQFKKARAYQKTMGLQVSQWLTFFGDWLGKLPANINSADPKKW